MRDELVNAPTARERGLPPCTRHLFNLGFTISKIWLSAWLNINMFTIIESFAGPAGAIILLLLPEPPSAKCLRWRTCVGESVRCSLFWWV